MERVAIIYNDPELRNYNAVNESIAPDDILTSVTSVGGALDKLGYEYTCVPLCSPMELIEKELNKINVDIVFNLFEGYDGCAGSEAAVANILERLGLCFTGASSKALLLCEDKSKAKQILAECAIPTPDWQVLSPTTCNDFNLEFPCIVKLLGEHASYGLSEKSVVWYSKMLREQVQYVWQAYERLSLVEKFLPGREFRVLIVGNECPTLYPMEEIIYTLPANKPRLLTYSAKWIPEHEYYNGSYEKCPVEIEPKLRQIIEAMAIQAFDALNCKGYASVDIRQDETGQLMVIDVNPNTDIYAGGGVQLPLEAAGIDYAAFIDQILSLARNHFETRQPLELYNSVTVDTSSSNQS
ncbi:MAG: ATP-grasp domain-containing protein [Dehalococcoidales bacterium]|nr:ATP-grasp domain-containing protein [Dehalococcoidales bacterium]